VPEQVTELKNMPSRIVVGTPNRLHRLFDEKALNLNGCKMILLDISERDSKDYTLLTLPG
jgi:superfamily II DNA/RNA helicase